MVRSCVSEFVCTGREREIEREEREREREKREKRERERERRIREIQTDKQTEVKKEKERVREIQTDNRQRGKSRERGRERKSTGREMDRVNRARRLFGRNNIVCWVFALGAKGCVCGGGAVFFFYECCFPNAGHIWSTQCNNEDTEEC